MSDRPAAGPDGVDVDRRQPHGEAGDAAAERHLGLAVADQADIRRGAAHVERDEIAAAGARAGSHGTHDARGGPDSAVRIGISAARATDISPPEDWQMPMPAPAACCSTAASRRVM